LAEELKLKTQNLTTNAVRVVAVEPFFSLETPGGEFSFGASTAGALTLAHVRVRVADTDGHEADGWGAIFLSHPWAFPTTDVTPEAKDALMRGIIEALGQHLVAGDDHAHPLDHFLAIEPAMGGIAAAVAAAQGIDVPVPPMCTLVCLSPIDAALHDAYGKLHGVNAFDALGPEHVGWDLSRVLGDGFSGKYLPEYLRQEPVESLPVWHTVGGTDPLSPDEARDVATAPLTEWIANDGVFAFKVKLKGKDLAWDIARLVDVHALAKEAGQGREIRLFGDLNEQGPSLEYIRSLVDGIREQSPEAFAALEALEQPDRREMGDDAMPLGEIAAQVPIALDEGLVSLAAIDRAVELGWNAVCLKTCKTQSLMLLALANCSELGLGITAQDLTNPGISLLQSVALASRLPVTMPIETNQRQYYPKTSAPEAAIWPDAYRVTDGHVSAAGLTGPGLGYDVSRIERDVFR
jgi:L-alanine-DL-glutamate epimerase-like enolase superfamily enzyme